VTATIGSVDRRSIVSDESIVDEEPIVGLGPRLRAHRQRAGLSVRAVASRLGVSASFISQLERGKTQPSVARLYALTQLLGLSIDELFSDAPLDGLSTLGTTDEPHAASSRTTAEGSSPERTAQPSPPGAWPASGDQSLSRLSITRAGDRQSIEMDTGVIWEQLAENTPNDIEFMEIIYPPHSSSTADRRLMQHDGWEFGYLVIGELEITVGFEVFTLYAGDALGFPSTTPHVFANLTDLPARGIWLQRHSPVER
jgi:transcriptional regulator with XRE-family HTH domain/mannose-6-phosphate isomerase-like protein (cupin superfamily)